MPHMEKRIACFLLVLLLVASSALGQGAAGDILVADFEGDGWGEWKATGDAFGSGPVHGTLPNQMAVDGFLGKGFVDSYHGGDRSTGTLTSPKFRIERKYISFLIGGGGFSNK